MKDETLRKAMAKAGAKGGSRNTDAQAEARRKNAEKARKARAAKVKKLWCGYCDEYTSHSTQDCVLPIVN